MRPAPRSTPASLSAAKTIESPLRESLQTWYDLQTRGLVQERAGNCGRLDLNRNDSVLSLRSDIDLAAAQPVR